MHFTPPPRHRRNSCLCTLTGRTSKLLPREAPIWRGWLISQVQTTTKSCLLNMTRAFPAHAMTLVEPATLQDPCPPQRGWGVLSIPAAVNLSPPNGCCRGRGTKGFSVGHLPLPFQTPIPEPSSLFWVTEVCSVGSCPHQTWPVGNASRISKGKTWETAGVIPPLPLHGVMVAFCIPLPTTRPCSLFPSLCSGNCPLLLPL